MATAPEAKRLALLAVATAGGVTIARQVANGQPLRPIRTLSGVTIAGMILTLGAEAMPDLVRQFSALVLVTALFANAPDIWIATSRALGTANRYTLTPAEQAKIAAGNANRTDANGRSGF